MQITHPSFCHKTSFRLLSGVLLFSAAIIAIPQTKGEVTLPALFSDHMVLQGGAAAPVWGWSDPGEQVTVLIGQQKKTAVAGADGKWMVRLDKMPPGGPTTLTVQGKNILTIQDVLIGEVWCCSGQSNMYFFVGQIGQIKNFQKEKADLPKIRMFKEESGPATEPQGKPVGSWVICTSQSIRGFSAVAFFFGLNLHEKLQQPIGLISTAMGGTPIEAWTSLEAQKSAPELKPMLDSWNARVEKFRPAAEATASGTAAVPENPRQTAHFPGNLFNGKIAPLIPYAIRGAIWYQGEANASSPIGAQRYAVQLPVLIQDWRARWGQGDFPFAWVQLPNYYTERESGWCALRESQRRSLNVPNTGMAVTLELGEPGNLHPQNKRDVGYRLSLWALAKVYGQKIPFSGPLLAEYKTTPGAIICTFQHTDGGLKAREGELKGFMIAGADQKWVPAQARIEGEKVIVSSPEVPQPVAVRYGWTCVAEASLVNGADLPASPFRTDDWPL